MDYKELIENLNGYFEGKELKRGDALKAATAIETLLAERESAGWISVKDRLPETTPEIGYDKEEYDYSEESETVLTADNSGNINVSYFAVFKPMGEKEIRCFLERSTDSEYMGKITHWMPLPEPPCCSEERGDTP